jgi:tetratricopeptide (TPR) repeat protein
VRQHSFSPTPFEPLNAAIIWLLTRRNHLPVMDRYSTGMCGPGWGLNLRRRIADTNKQETRMFSSTIRFLTLAMFLAALVAAPLLTPAMAAGGGGGGGDISPNGGSQMDPNAGAPSRTDTKAKATSTQKKKPSKQSLFDDPAFATGYRAAYATIYDRNDYAAAIDQLKALGHDDHPNVANLIGYSYRKLGDYKLSQVWYERALKADPNHVLTWQYYGLWQIEQGNRDQAQYHLSRIAAICGTDCAEYRSLAEALEKPPGTGLVY